MKSKRKLAAIMFTDIVGYTALMGKDSAKALELLRINREIQKPLVEKHGGKWLKEMGDGALAQFDTALDAVKCAVEIQKLARGDLDAKLRIGIHSGDITVENNDIYGDGVNVAARLQSIADPGGIYISESIEKAIQGQTDIQAKYLGEVKLKNVAYGVRTYAVQGVGLPVPQIKEHQHLKGHFWAEVQRRGLVRTGVTYLVVSLLAMLLLPYAQSMVNLPHWAGTGLLGILVVGFLLAMYLAWNFERSPEGFVRTTSQQSRQNPYKGSLRKPLTSNVIITGLTLIIVGMYLYPRYLSGDESVESVATEKSIAVLPFVSLSSDPEKQYLADGVMDALLLHLSKIENLRVITRTSVERYRRTDMSIPEIAAELNVQHVLEGSFQKHGDQANLIVQLSNAKQNEDHLWADEYHRDWSNIFAVQSEVAQTIARELKAVITPEEKRLIEKRPTTSLTAYDFYQRGREELLRYGLGKTEKDALKRAEDLFHKALEYDSTFAQAYTGLANVYFNTHYWDEFLSQNFMDSLLVLANTALSFDDQLAEAYVIRGNYYTFNYDKEQALKEYDKALNYNPNSDEAFWQKGVLHDHDDLVETIDNFQKAASLHRGARLPQIYIRLGRSYAYAGFKEKAIDYSKEALKLDGDSAVYYGILMEIEDGAGNPTKSIEFGNKSYAMDSTNYWVTYLLGIQHMFQGESKEYLNFMKKHQALLEAADNPSPFTMFRVGHAYWINGYEDEAETHFETGLKFYNEMIALGRHFSKDLHTFYNLAAINAFLGNKEKAYEYLALVNQRTRMPRWMVKDIKKDPLFDSIRDESEFQQIVKDVELKYQAEHERVRGWLEKEGML